ncbi:Galactose oxidase central domain [Babesia microti strain RI]|uniref:Galactose oxidase central domain n=1 Tax=Babesia microti (strain RI) TaxID=1133968 RepID=A0A1N6LXR0_BABMR|nr:Galactose oxidase central domain [Babesia microti strain RI]SIO73651.1 Galactose oxidase central domain [Babesia microti strain RI]|eukprot:XP_021337728.1 Galactose oxidase central domain [Babesia microti strain RI]
MSGGKSKRSAVYDSEYKNAAKDGRKSAISENLYKKKKSEPIGQYLDRYTKLLDSITPSETPSPRNNATLTLINNNELFLFGGEYCNGNIFNLYNDSYIYDLNVNKWSLIKCNNKPKPRCSHQIVKYNDVLFMFGGEFATKNEYFHYNDLWTFTLTNKTWIEIKTNGTIPSGRSGHKMGIWNDNIILFGGFYDTNYECKYHNDLYLYNIKSNTWSKLESINPGPIPRSASIFSIKDNILFIYGGYSKINDIGIAHSDTWTTDLQHMATNGNKIVWEKRKLSGEPPRAEICYGNCVNDGVVYLFGGIRDINDDMDSIFYNDLFTINPQNRKWINLYRTAQPESLDSLKFNDKTSNFPIERANSLLAYSNNVLYVYGGIREFKKTDVILSDMWKYENNNWTCLIPCDIQNVSQSESDSVEGSCDSSVEFDDSIIEYEEYGEESDITYSNYSSDDDKSGEEEICKVNDFLLVKKGEKLRDFFERTKEHWLQKIPSENMNEKDAKRIAFENCKFFYEN